MVEPDRWSRWLLERRDAGNPRQRELTERHLAPIRDKVLELAGPLAGATLLDVGTGTGLIGLEARARGAEVIFADVSPALLERFGDAHTVLCRAEDLAGVGDASVDIVTTRSVLIYVADKAAAFAAMHRVLRPGGRIALFEPINRLIRDPPGRFMGYETATGLEERVVAAFGPAAPAMLGFDDRDLARLAEAAGFSPVHVECHTDVRAGVDDVSFDALLDGAPNPNARTVREAIDAALAPPERERFRAALHEAFTAGRRVWRSVHAYVAAAKPG